MRLLESAAAGLVLLALGVVIVLALLGAAIRYLLRCGCCGRPAPGSWTWCDDCFFHVGRAGQLHERTWSAMHGGADCPFTDVGDDQRDYGDEDPGVVVPVRPEPLYCVRCGHREVTLASAPMPGPCPDCGGTRWGNRPDLPILGEPKELLP